MPVAGDLARLRRLFLDAGEREVGVLADLADAEAPVPRDVVESVLDTADVQSLGRCGLIRLDGDRYVPLARVDKVDNLLVVSDVWRRREEPDVVVGPGKASMLLARYVRPAAAGCALDLGCGSGVLSLILASAGAAVTGLDINPRAVAFARFNAALNGFGSLVVTDGDFLADEADASFDRAFETVVANPPFVLAPVGRLVYRDRSLPGDQVSERTVERVARALAPGGRGYVLCNWIGRDDDEWVAPVRRWVAAARVDALVVRVGDHSPEAYAAAWNHRVPEPARTAAIAEWTRFLVDEGARRVHAGLIALGRPLDPATTAPRFETASYEDPTITWSTIEHWLAGA